MSMKKLIDDKKIAKIDIRFPTNFQIDALVEFFNSAKDSGATHVDISDKLYDQTERGVSIQAKTVRPETDEEYKERTKEDRENKAIDVLDECCLDEDEELMVYELLKKKFEK